MLPTIHISVFFTVCLGFFKFLYHLFQKVAFSRQAIFVSYYSRLLQSLSHFYSLGRGRGVVLPNITSSFIFRGQQLPKLLLAKRNTSANKNPNSKSRKSVLHTKNPNKLKLDKLFMVISYSTKLSNTIKQTSLSLQKA